MVGVGTADPEASEVPEGGKKIEVFLQDEVRDEKENKNLIDICDKVLGENSYQIIIFDSD